jgi:hypothetical protein
MGEEAVYHGKELNIGRVTATDALSGSITTFAFTGRPSSPSHRRSAPAS